MYIVHLSSNQIFETHFKFKFHIMKNVVFNIFLVAPIHLYLHKLRLNNDTGIYSKPLRAYAMYPFHFARS